MVIARKILLIVVMLLAIWVFSDDIYPSEGATTDPFQLTEERWTVEKRLLGLKNGTNWIAGYKEGVWDCSNQATFLQSIVFYDHECRIVQGQLSSKSSRTGWLIHAMLKIKINSEWWYINPPDLSLSQDPPDWRVDSVIEFENYHQAIKKWDYKGIVEYGLDIYYVMDTVFQKKEDAQDVPASQ